MAVMVYHASSSLLPGGFIGVDVFFVISGYVVSASLTHDSSKTFLQFTLGFYARRILRILPALVVCLLVSSFLTALLIPSAWLSRANAATALSAFFGLSNVALLIVDDGYFAPRADFNPFTHTWSLAVEEQFYVIFPLVFFVWLRYRTGRGVGGLVSSWALAGLLLVSLAISGIETTAHPERAFYLIFSRFWELAAGAILFQLHQTGRLLPSSSRAATSFLVAGLLTIALALVVSGKGHFPFPWAMLSVTGSVLALMGLVDLSKSHSIAHRSLAYPGFVFVGRLSYSLYLWHWPVYVLFRWTIGFEEPLQVISASVVTFVLSVLSYYYVERPIWRIRNVLVLPNGKIVSYGVLVLLVSFGLTHWIFKAQPTISLSVTSKMDVWYPGAWHSDREPPAGGNLLQDRRLFVIGDSHALAYQTMLTRLMDRQGVEVRIHMPGGCPVANLLQPYEMISACETPMSQLLFELLSEASKNDVVFLASLRTSRVGDQWGTFDEAEVLANRNSPETRLERELALVEAREILRRLFEITPHVIIDAPMPVFRSPPFRCSDFFNSSNPVCEGGLVMNRNFLLAHREAVMESLTILQSEFNNLIVWDPFPILCDSEICSAFDGGMPLFFDGDHLSAHGNRVLYPAFETLLKAIWKSDKN